MSRHLDEDDTDQQEGRTDMGICDANGSMPTCDRCGKSSDSQFFGDVWGGYTTLSEVSLKAVGDDITSEAHEILLCNECQESFAVFMGRAGSPARANGAARPRPRPRVAARG